MTRLTCQCHRHMPQHTLEGVALHLQSLCHTSLVKVIDNHAVRYPCIVSFDIMLMVVCYVLRQLRAIVLIPLCASIIRSSLSAETSPKKSVQLTSDTGQWHTRSLHEHWLLSLRLLLLARHGPSRTWLRRRQG